MKRFLSVACGLMLVTGIYACGSSDSDGKDVISGDVVLPGDGTTTDQFVTPDPGRDPGQGVDPGENDDPGTPVDPGTDVITVTDPGTDSGTPACVYDPVGSCRAAYECINECPSGTAGEACVQQCQYNLSAVGTEDYEAFNQCLQTKCAGATTNEQFNACLEANCMNEYFGCFWGCTYATCDDMKACIRACPEDNPSTTAANEFRDCMGDCQSESTTEAQIDCSSGTGGCYSLLGCLNDAESSGDQVACVFGASEDALDMYNAIPDCLMDACPVCEVTNPTQQQKDDCTACFSAEQRPGGACGDTLQACQEDRTYGTGGCNDLLGCLNAATNNQERQACADATSKDGVELYDAIPDCLSAACPVCETDPDGAACNTCWSDEQKEGGACADTLQACLEDRTYGTDGCNSLLGCLNTATTPQERQACGSAASKEGIDLYDAISTCLLAACPICDTDPDGAACNTCWSDEQKEGGACADTLQACLEDRVYGTGNCSTLLTCLDGATTPEERQTCGNAASKAALDLYDALPDCLRGACVVCTVEDPTEQQIGECTTCVGEEQAEGGACYDTLQACTAN